MNILIIEDNESLAGNIGDYLATTGHTVDFARDGRRGLALAEAGTFDALVVDLMLPGIDGIEVCTRLRAAGNTVPILMLTARDELDDKLDGFDSGADDYVVKPVALRELGARLTALHRRHGRDAWQRELSVADLHFDVDALVATRAGRTLDLSPTLRRLLEHLIRNTHRTVSRRELEQVIWGENPPDSDALRSHIYALRREIDGHSDTPLLRTVYGAGYRLTDHDAG